MNKNPSFAKILIWCVVFAVAASCCLWSVFASGGVADALKPFDGTSQSGESPESLADPLSGEGPAAPGLKEEGPAADKEKPVGPAEKPAGPAKEKGPAADKKAPTPPALDKGPAAEKEGTAGPSAKKAAEPVATALKAAGPSAAKDAPKPPAPDKTPAPNKPEPVKKGPAAEQPTESAIKSPAPAPGTPGGSGSAEAVRVDNPLAPLPTRAN